jgi:hypothetical protein
MDETLLGWAVTSSCVNVILLGLWLTTLESRNYFRMRFNEWKECCEALRAKLDAIDEVIKS